MTNEIIFILTALIDLAFVSSMLMFGRGGLGVSIVVNLILITTFGAKLIPIFGVVTNVGNVFYATIFTAAMILTERYGKKEAYASVWIGFLGLVVFMGMAQFTTQMASVPEGSQIADAMHTIFDGAIRIAIASIAAYLVSQHVNIWAFDYLRTKQSTQALWIRVMASTFMGQLLDSAIFFSIAFAGEVPMNILLETIIVGFAAKISVAALSIPFIATSRFIKIPEEKKDISPII